jgi:rhamnogalacturonyl hydrolase YesR
LLDAEEFPQPETSGTAFFCFAYAWGINHGTLERDKYLPATMKAWHALVGKVAADGKLGHVQKVAAGPGEVKPDDTHEYAVGAFLLAGCEIVKLIDAR